MRTVQLIAPMVALWVFLGTTLEWVSALAGLLLAVVIILALRGNLLSRFFVGEGTEWRRPLGLVMAALRYGWVVVQANLSVASVTFRWGRKVSPAILRLHTGEMGDLEQTVLANSITLTPGTITVEFSADRQYLYVHVLDVGDLEVARGQLREHLEVHFGRGLRWWIAPST